MARWPIFLLGLLACPPGEAGTDPQAFARDLDTLVAASLKQLPMVPGLAVAVVKDGRVLVARGYGSRDGNPEHPVTENTPYYIASSTKSFVGLTALLLERQGKLSLDKTLTDYFPAAKFPQDIPANRISLNRLLTHSAGIENDPIVNRWAYTGEQDAAQLKSLLRFTVVDAKAPLGDFHYGNIGYDLAGLAMQEATGKTWQDLLAETVFTPLAMHDTGTTTSDAKELAPPLMADNRGAQPVYLAKTDAIMHPAGGSVSTAHDMARWLLMEVNEGQVDGKPLFPRDIIRRSQQPKIGLDEHFGDYSREGYGYGWYIGHYLDQRFLHHFGSFPGYRAHVSFMPEQKLGVVVLTNESVVGFRLVDLVANYAYQWWLKPENLEARFQAQLNGLADKATTMLAGLAGQREKQAQRPWALGLAKSAYAGTYHSDAFGDIHIRENAGQLTIRLGLLEARAQPYPEPESLRLELVPGEGELMRFQRDATGAVQSLIYWGGTFDKR